jgi:hypothetical protein
MRVPPVAELMTVRGDFSLRSEGHDGRAELNALIDSARTEPWLTEGDVYALLRLCCEGAAEG